eukprot:PhF_6_TR14922/c0_g1_i1/m.23332
MDRFLEDSLGKRLQKAPSLTPRYLHPRYDLPRKEIDPKYRFQMYPETVPKASDLPYTAAASFTGAIVGSIVWTPMSHFVETFRSGLLPGGQKNQTVFSPKIPQAIRNATQTSWLKGLKDNIGSGTALGGVITFHRYLVNPHDVLQSMAYGAAAGTAIAFMVHPYDVVSHSSAIHNTSRMELIKVIYTREKQQSGISTFVRKMYNSVTMSCVGRMLYYVPLFVIPDIGKSIDREYCRWYHLIGWSYMASLVGLWLMYPVGHVQRLFIETNTLRSGAADRASKRGAHVTRYASYFELVNEMRRTRGFTTVWNGITKTRPFTGAWKAGLALALQDFILREGFQNPLPLFFGAKVTD